ncbi:toll/interleukin-1 receptor domain-containing protein [Tahibacter sp. UC22_41]|uniref:toll/interleukin-1 receptor domain-containing protein n=1 Tax=Tahibacter sp. UC22_41 TaxID=3350178 RepID=UPI0036DAADB9
MTPEPGTNPEGWHFTIVGFISQQAVICDGGTATLVARVSNAGHDIGTVYARFLVTNSHEREKVVFDSDRDLSDGRRMAFRLVDIAPGETREAVCKVTLPRDMVGKHFDIRLEVWNPHRLYAGRYPLLFDDSDWLGGFCVVAGPAAGSENRVFISYAHKSERHGAWVRELAEALMINGIFAVADWNDLQPGQDIDFFMQQCIDRCEVALLICSDEYTRRADSEEPSGVRSETLQLRRRYLPLSQAGRSRFIIPIVCDNALAANGRLPGYLGDTMAIDMSGAGWRGQPLARLVEAVQLRLDSGDRA